MSKEETTSYAEQRAFFDGMLTIYGRKPVQEALGLEEIKPYRLHLAESNRPVKIVNDIIRIAHERAIDIRYHSKKELSRISKNSRQDQGVALDIAAPGYRPVADLEYEPSCELIALENVTNPQNVGMIIRTVGASPCKGLILPKQGCAKIDGMVIKASAGTALKIPIYHCNDPYSGLTMLKEKGFHLIGLSSHAETELAQIDIKPSIFVLGNETHGLSEKMLGMCDQLVRIPLNNQIESLNVGIAAGIVSFRSVYKNHH